MLAGVVGVWVVGPVTVRADEGGPLGGGGSELWCRIIPRVLVVRRVVRPPRACSTAGDAVGALVLRMGVVPALDIGIAGRVVSPRVGTLRIRVRVPLCIAFILSPTVREHTLLPLLKGVASVVELTQPRVQNT